MKRKHYPNQLLIGFLLITSIFVISCENSSTNPDSPKVLRDLTIAEKQLTEADNHFGLKLFRKMVAESNNDNIFISPLSVSMALGMTWNGSAGTTREAMTDVLEYGDLTAEEINQSYKNLLDLLQQADDQVLFQIANSIWYREGFSVLDVFLNTNKTYFDAVVRSLDFNRSDAADIINDWVSDKTNDKIKNIIKPPIDPLTVMFLINAIYFKGSWTYEFNKNDTKSEPFFISTDNQIECQMMSHKCEHDYFANDLFQAVDLPYGDGNFRMAVILPNYAVDIDSVIKSMDNATWNSWQNQFEKTEINLFLPKFKLEYEISLVDVLSLLGMGVAFTPGIADFTNINPDGNLYISKVKHKTFIDVNEEGTEAAAVTVVEITLSCVGDEIEMRVNRPFIVVLHEQNTGTILFIGKIVQPEYDD
jgi:serine protease inhibitor